MKSVRYSKDVDILTIELADGVLGYAREADQFIIHFSKRGVPLFLEIQDASKVLGTLEATVHGKKLTEALSDLERRTHELAALNRLFQSYLSEQIEKDAERRREYQTLLKRLIETLPLEKAPTQSSSAD